jgi:uncharacterized protein involved in outer membrane biogenesis
MSRIRQRGLLYGAIATVILVVLALVVLFFPWNTLRGPVASYFTHRLHRQVTIAGDLRVHLGSPVRVDVDDVSVANAPWSSIQPMARTAHMALTFGWRSLMHATPDTVRLTQPTLVLERNDHGDANWHFGNDENSSPLRFGDLDVDKGTLRYRDPRVRGDITVALQSTQTANAPQSLRFEGRGTLRGEPFTISGRGRGFSELRRIDDPYQLAFDLESGKTGVTFDGTVVPSSPQNLRGALHVRGPDLSKLYPIVPTPLPWTPAYNLTGDLTHENGKWTFRQINGTVGESDLAGNFSVDVSKPRPSTIANLSSRSLNYNDLGGFIGLPPGEAAQKTNTPEKRKEAQQRAASDRVLPNKSFELGKLRERDVDLQFRAAAAQWGRLPLDNLATHMVLKDGVLRFDPLDFGLADGHVVTNLTLDLTKRAPTAKAQIEVRRVELKRIFPQLAAPGGSAGRFGGRAQFTMSGNSIAELLAGAQGEAAIAMRGGEMSTLKLVLTNLDLARAAALLMRGGNEKAPLHCAIAAMHATHGVLTPDIMVIDSSEELIRGSGSVDFAHEKYDLALSADSKKPSLVALRGPINITGTFKSPVVKPALGQAIARVGAAVGLGILAPPLALLPLIDLGNAPNADCQALYRDAGITTNAARNAGAKNPATAERREKREERTREQVARTR